MYQIMRSPLYRHWGKFFPDAGPAYPLGLAYKTREQADYMLGVLADLSKRLNQPINHHVEGSSMRTITIQDGVGVIA
jgi:hypothetical protein